jgi:hypothetical protein
MSDSGSDFLLVKLCNEDAAFSTRSSVAKAEDLPIG